MHEQLKTEKDSDKLLAIAEELSSAIYITYVSIQAANAGLPRWWITWLECNDILPGLNVPETTLPVLSSRKKLCDFMDVFIGVSSGQFDAKPCNTAHRNEQATLVRSLQFVVVCWMSSELMPKTNEKPDGIGSGVPDRVERFKNLGKHPDSHRRDK